MTSRIHPSAVVDPRAELGVDVVVGPGAVVGPGVRVDTATEIQAHAVLERDTDVGRRCLIGYGAVLGGTPQDIHYRDEPTRVTIGDDTRIGEYATVHRGTAASGLTRRPFSAWRPAAASSTRSARRWATSARASGGAIFGTDR